MSITCFSKGFFIFGKWDSNALWGTGEFGGGVWGGQVHYVSLGDDTDWLQWVRKMLQLVRGIFSSWRCQVRSHDHIGNCKELHIDGEGGPLLSAETVFKRIYNLFPDDQLALTICSVGCTSASC